MPTGALLVWVQVVTAPVICVLELFAPPGCVTQPVSLTARIVAALARHGQVGRMACTAISAALQVFQCSGIWAHSLVWSVSQHDVLSAVAAASLLLPEQKPFEIPCSARVHRCLQVAGPSWIGGAEANTRLPQVGMHWNLGGLQPLRGLLDLMYLKRQFLDARLFQ